MAFKLHRRRSEAERAILSAIGHCASNRITPAQTADLADAVDAYREKSYGVAYELARAALTSRRTSMGSLRPEEWGRSLAEIRAEFAAARARRLPAAAPPSQSERTPSEG